MMYAKGPTIMDFIRDAEANVLPPPPVDVERTGQHVAIFYNQLTDNGVPDDVALELTKQFLARLLT